MTESEISVTAVPTVYVSEEFKGQELSSWLSIFAPSESCELHVDFNGDSNETLVVASRDSTMCEQRQNKHWWIVPKECFMNRKQLGTV